MPLALSISLRVIHTIPLLIISPLETLKRRWNLPLFSSLTKIAPLPLIKLLIPLPHCHVYCRNTLADGNKEESTQRAAGLTLLQTTSLHLIVNFYLKQDAHIKIIVLFPCQLPPSSRYLMFYKIISWSEVSRVNSSQ